MAEPHNTIFRAEAIRQHEQSREQSVLPRLATPRVVPFLWVLLGLLIGSGMIFWFTLAAKRLSGE